MTAPSTTTFAVDTASERAVARFRLVVGILVALGALAIGLMSPSPMGILALIFCVLFASFMIRSYFSGMTRSRLSEGEPMTLSDTSLQFFEGGKRVEIAWSEIESAEVDEERVTVRLKLASGADRHLEPRYQGVAIDVLAETIESYRTRSPR